MASGAPTQRVVRVRASRAHFGVAFGAAKRHSSGTMHVEGEEDAVDAERRKQLLREWKSRRPEMGVVSIRCTATGDEFLAISKDMRAWANSHVARLEAGNHGNAKLQGLWNEHGKDALEFSVVELLDYDDDPSDDHAYKLDKLLETCLAQHPGAERL